MFTFKSLLEKLLQRTDLTVEESRFCMIEIMEGRLTAAQLAAYLTALRMKGETVSEILGSAEIMREKAETVPLTGFPENLLDTCGTGGDGAGTINLSTAAALVVAGAGGKVAKHGNRSVSSKSGSADVLEALGVNLSLTVQQVGLCLDKVGFAFLFAPQLHKAMKYAAAPRRELGIRTIFNLLGPLTNPAGANCQLLGVYAQHLTPIIAEVLGQLGCKRAMVVQGAGGLDEVSPLGETQVSEYKEDQVTTYTITPADFGFEPFPLSSIQGGSPRENAVILGDVLNGKPGAARKAVIMNAACAFMVADMAGTFKEGAAFAAYVLDSGKAMDCLHKLREVTQQLAGEEGTAL